MIQYKLSIITLCYNKYPYTKQCLDGLFKLDPNDYEVIVFDNGSTDQTQMELSKINRSNFRYIRSEMNGGYAYGNNRAYAKAQAPNVLFLNNDTRVTETKNVAHWPEILLEHCETALVGPTMGQLDQDFNFIREVNAELLGLHTYLSGWCLASSKNILNKFREKTYIGPFSEDYFCYFEDSHMGKLAHKLNIPLKVVKVPIVHLGKVSSAQLNTRNLYLRAQKIFKDNWRK